MKLFPLQFFDAAWVPDNAKNPGRTKSDQGVLGWFTFS
jgi:hypothetical protein